MKDNRAFWHRLPDWKIQKMIKEGVSNGFVVENYRQPTWCNYPEALNGVMGCWSLTDIFGLRKMISKKFCSECDCCTLPISDQNDKRSVATDDASSKNAD
jgi:hypothetical protein